MPAEFLNSQPSTATPDAAPAPEATDKQPSVKAEAPAPKPEATKPTKEIRYEETGNKALNASLRMLGKAGIDPDSFEMKAARQGNFDPLKAVLHHLGNEDADIAVELMEQAYHDHVANKDREQKQLIKELHSIAGGSEQWDATLDWVVANADKDEEAELLAALEAGGPAARMAARYMTTLYAQFGSQAPAEDQPEEEQNPAPRATAAASGTAGQRYITAQEYAKQVESLYAAGASKNDPRVVRLQKQRISAIRAGH